MQLDKGLFKIAGKAEVALNDSENDILESSFVDYKGDFN